VRPLLHDCLLLGGVGVVEGMAQCMLRLEIKSPSGLINGDILRSKQSKQPCEQSEVQVSSDSA